ncbi:MAG: ATP-binding cassette domain-containing protein [Bacteroidales bacterium]|nr:ATP-binding cassette domain-containing protein [Bacteroidales bacterium]
MTAIEFENISKQYRLGLVSTRTLSHDLNRWWTMNILRKEDPYLKIGEVNDRSHKGKSEYVWALRDINFKVEQGDVVGIIGKNGAGKSTLLKILSKVTSPTTGTIKTRGRIGSLLEVGTGFHPEMTGRENIYMNGAILGMTKQEINRKLDEIIDFSGCERYIDTPVKRYSSGMMVRLGFSVAAHLEPEILVVDEVLAVGDAEFQKKAIGKMQDVSRGEGRTVLFVSHNMASVRSLCNLGIVLQNGNIFFQGTVNDAINEYMQTNLLEINRLHLDKLPRERKCSGLIRFVSMKFLNDHDEEINPHCGQYLCVRLEIDVKYPGFNSCMLSFDITDIYGSPLMSFPTKFTMDNIYLSEGRHVVSCEVPKLPLTKGSYYINPWAEIKRECADYIESKIMVDVEDDDFFGRGRSVDQHLIGKILLCDHRWVIS